MSDRFPDDCPTLTRDGQVVGFSPSPDGMALFAWWRHTSHDHTDSEMIGAYRSYEAAVVGVLRAIAADGSDPDPDDVAVEARHLQTVFTATDWMGLGF